MCNGVISLENFSHLAVLFFQLDALLVKVLFFILQEIILCVKDDGSNILILIIELGGKKNEKTYNIEVDCANCANLMEDATKKTSGVADATVNFMTQKMIVHFVDGSSEKEVMKAVQKACKKVEPDCEIFM